jgi:hypothetical protein
MELSIELKLFLLMISSTVLNAQTEYHDKYRTYLADAVDKTSFQDSRILPVLDSTNSISVSVDFQIISISKLDTFTGSMDFSGRLYMTWNNQQIVLTATQKEWLDFEARVVDQDSIWTPDLAVYNSMAQRQRLGDSSYRIRIDMDGNCRWLIGVVASTFCTFDVTLFPFDKPSCDISFTTWRYKSDEILLTAANDSVDFSLYYENSEWTIENSTANLTIENDVSYLNYTIHFKRNAGFFLVNMILPILMVALLNSMTFLLPMESGERLTYAVLLFLWFVVYLDIVTTNLPMSSTSISNLSLFVISMVGISVLTICLDIISISIYNKDDTKFVPGCLESFVRCLRCRCGGSNESRIIPLKDVEKFDDNAITDMSDVKAPTTVAFGTKNVNRFELRLQDFEMPRNNIDKKVDLDYEPRKRKSDEIDWKTVSSTFDYIFFVIVLFATLGLTGYFLVPLIAANS